MFLVQYDYSGYFQSENVNGCCTLQGANTQVTDGSCILPPSDYGYKGAYDSSHFNIRYNIWTLTTAWSVNQGISTYELLDVVQTDLTRSSAGCYSLNSFCSSTSAGNTCTGSVTVTVATAPVAGSSIITGLPANADTSTGGAWPPSATAGPTAGSAVSGTGIQPGTTVKTLSGVFAIITANIVSTSSPEITVTSTSGLVAGTTYDVTGTCVPSSTTLTATSTTLTATKITLNKNPTTSGTCVLTFTTLITQTSPTPLSYSIELDKLTTSGATGLSFTFTQSGFSSTGLLYDPVLSTCSIEVSNQRLYIEARMDSKWPGMDPIYCMVSALGGATAKGCFVRIGNTFVLPFFNHLGLSGKPDGDFFNWKTQCACSAPSFTGMPTQTFTASTLDQGTNTNVAPKLGGGSNYNLAMSTTASITDYSGTVGCTVSATTPSNALTSGTKVTAVTGTVLTLSSELQSNIPIGTTITFICPMNTYYDPIYKSSTGSTSYTYGSTDAYCNMFDLIHGFALLKGTWEHG